jgi:murein DD-endopeptidase MepM/ murein hydrolase activator NlpD
MRWTPFVVALIAVLAPLGTASAGQPPAAPVAGFSWPLAPPHPVLRPFQAPSVPWGPGHRGVDLGGQPGDPVLSVADGIVVFAGVLVDRPVVSVDHAGGLRSTYEPVTPVVAAGQAVHRGEVLGHLEAGHPECTGAPACLHWGIRRGEEYLDPLALVTARHVRLLPWRDA